jgi:hypothetical protein
VRVTLVLLLGLVTVSALAQEGPPVSPDVERGHGDPLPFAHCRWVPAAACTPRLGDRNWSTDLDVLNRGSGPAHLSVALLARDADNRTVSLATLAEPLAQGATLHLPDVVTLVLPWLWRNWLGGLVVCSDRPGLEVFSRTYLLGAGEATTVGQGIPGLALADAIQPGTVGHLLGLREEERFRSHLGLLNPSPVAVEVTVRLKDDAGATLVTLVHDLPAYGQVQYNNVLARFAGGVATGRAEVSCPTAPLFAYATLIDNASSDPTYIPSRVTGE